MRALARAGLRGRGLPLDAARARAGRRSTPSCCRAASRTRTACAPARSPRRTRWWTRSPSAPTRAAPVLGICNGAQVLVEAGLVPGGGGVALALARNRMPDRARLPDALGALPGGGVAVRVHAARWTRGALLPLPVAHGEGRFTSRTAAATGGAASRRDRCRCATCAPDGEPAQAFPDNPNGAELAAAAPSATRAGNVLAMMPHPERVLDLGALARASRRRVGRAGATARSRAAARGVRGLAGDEALRRACAPTWRTHERVTGPRSASGAGLVELRAEDPEASSALVVARERLDGGARAARAAALPRVRAARRAAGDATSSRSGCTARRSSTIPAKERCVVRAGGRRSPSPVAGRARRSCWSSSAAASAGAAAERWWRHETGARVEVREGVVVGAAVRAGRGRARRSARSWRWRATARHGLFCNPHFAGSGASSRGRAAARTGCAPGARRGRGREDAMKRGAARKGRGTRSAGCSARWACRRPPRSPRSACTRCSTAARSPPASSRATRTATFHVRKGIGLVADVYRSAELAQLPGQLAIGHNRYSTAGGLTLENTQPLRGRLPRRPAGARAQRQPDERARAAPGPRGVGLDLPDHARHRDVPAPDGALAQHDSVEDALAEAARQVRGRVLAGRADARAG